MEYYQEQKETNYCTFNTPHVHLENYAGEKNKSEKVTYWIIPFI